MNDLVKRLLAKDGDRAQAATGSAGRVRFLVEPSAAAPATAEMTRPYRLILRDLFADHRLAGKEVSAKGIACVQRDMVCVSPEDAAVLGLTDGDALFLESASGAVARPVTVKAGIKQGVLECLLFQKRSEILALSSGPAKVIDVSIRKG